MHEPRTIFVAGGAGFVGGCFTRMAVAAGSSRVVVIDTLNHPRALESISSLEGHSEHVVARADIADADSLSELMRLYEPSWIANFAACSSGISGGEMQTNVIGLATLLETVQRHWRKLSRKKRFDFRFLQVSTDEVFGDAGETGKFTETTAFAPNSLYAASRAAGDHLVRAHHQSHGFPTLTTNACKTYGPYQSLGGFVPDVIRGAVHGAPIAIPGDGSQLRNWLFVEDHCRALFAVLENGRVGDTYNIATDEPRTFLEVAQAICEVVDDRCPDLPHRPSDTLIQQTPPRPGLCRRALSDASRLTYELEWSPRASFQNALAATTEWYLEHRPWLESTPTPEARHAAANA